VREVSIRQAREGLRALLAEVQAGEEVVLLRRGKPVARIVPIAGEGQNENRLPKLGTFRASIQLKGGPLGEALAAARAEERY
jgi:prevent-host-death family protein